MWKGRDHLSRIIFFSHTFLFYCCHQSVGYGKIDSFIFNMTGKGFLPDGHTLTSREQRELTFSIWMGKNNFFHFNLELESVRPPRKPLSLAHMRFDILAGVGLIWMEFGIYLEWDSLTRKGLYFWTCAFALCFDLVESGLSFNCNQICFTWFTLF